MSSPPPLASVAAACQAAVEELSAAGFDLPSVYLLSGGRLRCYAARGYYQVVDGFPPGTGVIGRVVASGQSVLLEDVRRHPEFISAVPGLRAEAAVPVRCGDRVIGAINVESRSALPQDVLSRLGAVAASLGSGLEALGGLPPPTLSQRLARTAVQLTGTTDAKEIEQRAAIAAADIAGMSSAAVAHIAPRRPGVATAFGPLAERLQEWRRPEIETMAGWVRAGTSSHFPGGDSIPTAYLFLRAVGVRGLSVHPLMSRGATTGLLLVADREPVAHTPQVVEALELLAAQTAALLTVAELVEELSRRADEDGLTGLRNAAAFASDLARPSPPTDLRRAALLLMDIDHFKAVNDTHGHLAGDCLLKQLSARMVGVVRTEDRVYRIGGDEFAVLAQTRDADELDALARRLLAAAADLGTAVSIGTSEIRAGEADQARAAADEALYRAKAAGRGRIRHAGSVGPGGCR